MSNRFTPPPRPPESLMSEIEEMAAEICAAVGEPWFGVGRCTAGRALDAMVTAYRLAILESPSLTFERRREPA